MQKDTSSMKQYQKITMKKRWDFVDQAPAMKLKLPPVMTLKARPQPMSCLSRS